MSYLYNLVFFEPLLNGLALLIKYLPLHDMGLISLSFSLWRRGLLFFPLPSNQPLLK